MEDTSRETENHGVDRSILSWATIEVPRIICVPYAWAVASPEGGVSMAHTRGFPFADAPGRSEPSVRGGELDPENTAKISRPESNGLVSWVELFNP